MADKCLQCGAAINRAAKFCPGCGTRVIAIPSPEREEAELPPLPAASKEGVLARDGVFAKLKSLHRSMGLLEKGAVFGAEVMEKISSFKKGMGESMRCVLDVRTEDRRTVLEADGEDMLWIFAEMISNSPEFATDQITRRIRFSVEGIHADWVVLGRPQMKDGMKAIRVKAEPPGRGGLLDSEEVRVVASATIDGITFVEPVTLRLEEEAKMKITIVE